MGFVPFSSIVAKQFWCNILFTICGVLTGRAQERQQDSPEKFLQPLVAHYYESPKICVRPGVSFVSRSTGWSACHGSWWPKLGDRRKSMSLPSRFMKELDPMDIATWSNQHPRVVTILSRWEKWVRATPGVVLGSHVWQCNCQCKCSCMTPFRHLTFLLSHPVRFFFRWSGTLGVFPGIRSRLWDA